MRTLIAAVCPPSGSGGARELGQAGSWGLRGRSQWEREGHRARDVQRKCDLLEGNSSPSIPEHIPFKSSFLYVILTVIRLWFVLREYMNSYFLEESKEGMRWECDQYMLPFSALHCCKQRSLFPIMLLFVLSVGQFFIRSPPLGANQVLFLSCFH